MGNILYSVTPLQAFSGMIAGVVLLLVFGIMVPLVWSWPIKLKPNGGEP